MKHPNLTHIPLTVAMLKFQSEKKYSRLQCTFTFLACSHFLQGFIPYRLENLWQNSVHLRQLHFMMFQVSSKQQQKSWGKNYIFKRLTKNEDFTSFEYMPLKWLHVFHKHVYFCNVSKNLKVWLLNTQNYAFQTPACILEKIRKKWIYDFTQWYARSSLKTVKGITSYTSIEHILSISMVSSFRIINTVENNILLINL